MCVGEKVSFLAGHVELFGDGTCVKGAAACLIQLENGPLEHSAESGGGSGVAGDAPVRNKDWLGGWCYFEIVHRGLLDSDEEQF